MEQREKRLHAWSPRLCTVLPPARDEQGRVKECGGERGHCRGDRGRCRGAGGGAGASEGPAPDSSGRSRRGGGVLRDAPLRSREPRFLERHRKGRARRRALPAGAEAGLRGGLPPRAVSEPWACGRARREPPPSRPAFSQALLGPSEGVWARDTGLPAWAPGAAGGERGCARTSSARIEALPSAVPALLGPSRRPQHGRCSRGPRRGPFAPGSHSRWDAVSP